MLASRAVTERSVYKVVVSVTRRAQIATTAATSARLKTVLVTSAGQRLVSYQHDTVRNSLIQTQCRGGGSRSPLCSGDLTAAAVLKRSAFLHLCTKYVIFKICKFKPLDSVVCRIKTRTHQEMR